MMNRSGQGTLNRALTVATAGIAIVVVIFVIGNVAGTTRETMQVDENRSVVVENLGTADIYDLVEDDDAYLSSEYDLSSGDNITVLLNSAVIIDTEDTTGTGTLENSYSELENYIEDGTNTLEVDVDGGTTNINSLTTDFWIQGTYEGEDQGVFDSIIDGIWDAFSMMPVVFIVMIAGLIITVLLGWTGIAGGGSRT